jgi:hypothetical protein
MTDFLRCSLNPYVIALASPTNCVVHCMMFSTLLLWPAASIKRLIMPGVQRIMYSIGYAFSRSIFLISRSTFLACLLPLGLAPAVSMTVARTGYIGGTEKDGVCGEVRQDGSSILFPRGDQHEHNDRDQQADKALRTNHAGT